MLKKKETVEGIEITRDFSLAKEGGETLFLPMER